jgi:hypothetical protein
VLPSHDSAYWIARFEREYPAAAEALQKAVSKVRCAGEYITPGMGLNAHRTRDQSARMHFEIFRNGDLLRWSRKCTDPSVPPDVMVLNQSEAFLLRSTKQDAASDLRLVELNDRSTFSGTVKTRVFVDRFVHAAFLLWDYQPLIVAYQSGALEITSVEQHERNPSLVTFRVKYKHNADAGTREMVGEGRLTLSPDEGWAIREYEYIWPYDAPSKLTMSLDVQSVDRIGFVPRAYNYQHAINKSGDTWEVVEEYTSVSLGSQSFPKLSSSCQHFRLPIPDRPDTRGSGPICLFGWRWRPS